MRELFNTLFKYREKKSPDRLGVYPESVHIPAMPERRYLWTSRVLVILSAISISLTMMLASVIFILLPQRGAIPELLRSESDFFRIERMEAAELSVDSREMLTQSLVEKYIRLRHEIPRSQFDLLQRWAINSEFYQLQSGKVYGRFANRATYDQVSKFVERGLRRRVEFDWIRRLTGKLYQVQFRTLNRLRDNPQITTIIWRAYVRVDYIEIEEEDLEKWNLNPFGFQVMNYSLAYVGTPERSEHYLETARKAAEQKN